MMRKFLFLTFVMIVVMTRLQVMEANTHMHGTDIFEKEVFRIFYPVNDIEIHENYMGNTVFLKRIQKYLLESSEIKRITIYSYASPEGPWQWNDYLARHRGITAKRYLEKIMPKGKELPDSIFELRPETENWEGLRYEVMTSYFEQDREVVLEILDDMSLSTFKKKDLLKRLNRGQTWRYIIKNIMPKLRYATWITIWRPIDEECVKVRPVKDELRPLTPVVNITSLIEKDTKTILALKTNLLYDAVSFVNFSVEAPLYKDKLSLVIQHQFPWWRWGKADNEYCVRFLSTGAEFRWWFAPQPRPKMSKRVKRDRFMGHHLGLYAMSGKWDFEWGRNICYQGEFWSTGLSYGYAMPIGKRLNLEFSLSLGYASIPYRHFTPTDDYSILLRDRDKVGTWHYFGPTKAEVSLVLPITIKTRK